MAPEDTAEDQNQEQSEEIAVDVEAMARDADFSQLEEEQEKGAVLSRVEIAQDSDDLTRLRAEVAENHDKYMRALADFENYKKRALKERSDLLKYQGEKILFDLLEVVDNLELALQHSEGDPEQLRSGVELIHKMFVDILSKWEVRGESGIGEMFDPEKQNALSRIAVDDAQPGTVINELKKTYYYKDRLLRAGEVVVCEARAEEEDSPAADEPDEAPPSEEAPEDNDGGEENNGDSDS